MTPPSGAGLVLARPTARTFAVCLLTALLATNGGGLRADDDVALPVADPSDAEAAVDVGDEVGGGVRGIRGFEPNYLLVGADSIRDDDGEPGDGDCDIKFQLSFSRRLTAPRGMRDGVLGRTFDRDSPLFFGFTQRAWWDICRESAPFRETNYAPSLFLKGTVTVGGDELDLLAGFVHQSNGEGGAGSVAWDRLFIRARRPFGERLRGLGFETSDRRRWWLDLTLWHPVGIADDNADIVRYAGYGELVLSYTPSRDTRVRLTARKGGGARRWERGLGELDVLFPLPGTDVQGMLQVTNGYGASLARFDRHGYAVRVGVVFSDITLP